MEKKKFKIDKRNRKKEERRDCNFNFVIKIIDKIVFKFKY